MLDIVSGKSMLAHFNGAPIGAPGSSSSWFKNDLIGRIALRMYIGGRTPFPLQSERHKIDSGVREGTTTADAKRLKELERENKELRRAKEILKVASAFFAQAEFNRRFKS